MEVHVNDKQLARLHNLLSKFERYFVDKTNYVNNLYNSTCRTSSKIKSCKNNVPFLQIIDKHFSDINSDSISLIKQYRNFMTKNPKFISELHSFSSDSLTYSKDMDNLSLLLVCMFYADKLSNNSINDEDKSILEYLCCHLFVSNIMEYSCVDLSVIESVEEMFKDFYNFISVTYNMFNDISENITIPVGNNVRTYSMDEVRNFINITRGEFVNAIINFDNNPIIIDFFSITCGYEDFLLLVRSYILKLVEASDSYIISELFVAYFKFYIFGHNYLFFNKLEENKFSKVISNIHLSSDAHKIAQYGSRIIKNYFGQAIKIIKDKKEKIKEEEKDSGKTAVPVEREPIVVKGVTTSTVKKEEIARDIQEDCEDQIFIKRMNALKLITLNTRYHEFYENAWNKGKKKILDTVNFYLDYYSFLHDDESEEKANIACELIEKLKKMVDFEESKDNNDSNSENSIIYYTINISKDAYEPLILKSIKDIIKRDKSAAKFIRTSIDKLTNGNIIGNDKLVIGANITSYAKGNDYKVFYTVIGNKVIIIDCGFGDKSFKDAVRTINSPEFQTFYSMISHGNIPNQDDNIATVNILLDSGFRRRKDNQKN